MATVFSKVLFEGVISPAGVATAVVPAGVKWVVRDIEAWNEDPTSPHVANGFRLSTGGGTVIWAREASNTRTQKSYRWEGRQVMETGDTLFVTTSDDLWSLRVSGYELTLP